MFEEAEWLRDPSFAGCNVIDFLHKEKASPPELSGPRNVHTYFRKEVELEGQPLTALIHVTADDYFKLYVNGTFVVQGPPPGYPFAYPYHTVDLRPFLCAGTNVLAAHVYYQGLRNRVWDSADNRSGFIAALELTLADGTTRRIVTDSSWRCFQSRTFPTRDTTGYDTQFLEHIDLREEPVGWREKGFDDDHWVESLTGRQDHVFVKSAIPPLEHWTATPSAVKQLGDGHYWYDFGGELVGHTRIRVRGPAGHVIEVRHGEELEGPDRVRCRLRANCVYQEFPVLSGRDDLIEFYDYRGFRFIEIVNTPTEPQVWVDVRHHPFKPDTALFRCSNDLASRIWHLCANGVRFGSQESFLDCPTREKGQYLGDAFVTSRVHLLLTGDGSLTRKALADFHHSQRICPGMMAVAPGSLMQEIAEYSLLWPLMLRRYYWFTGDRFFTQVMADKTLASLFGYFERFENEHGLLTNMEEKWVLVDWPANLRDDYDYEYARLRENAVLNAFYYASLSAAASLSRELDRSPEPHETKAERVKRAFLERLFNPATGLFLDAPGSSHSSLHANALPLAFGMVPAEFAPKIVEFIGKKRLACGPFIAPFVIEACYRAGRPDLGYDLLTGADEHSWHEMLRHGATTCMEVWGPDQKWNTSWCHPWSSSPVFLLAEHVMGLAPAKPGWRAVRFAPSIPESLDWAEITLPIPAGRVAVRYERAAGLTVTTPPGIPVEAEVPEGTNLTVAESLDHAQGKLSAQHLEQLRERGWNERVGEERGVWISVDEQVLRLIQGRHVLLQTPCSTATKGTGSQLDSEQTPLGWHVIKSKTGQDAAWGTVFRGGAPTGKVWQPGQNLGEDLVLTRILFLDGEEPGKNKGGNVDTFARRIYIHGTNDEEAIGTPSSHGCIRLKNSDIIVAFDQIPTGAPVLITQVLPRP